MTDSTVKNASMIAEDILIETKCTACGHIDNVPNWIIGELAEEDRISSKHGEVEIAVSYTHLTLPTNREV